MASKYWIKLYHEILDDPKMGRLPDHLWRRAIELFLLAGDNDCDGLLPPVEDIAWRLRSEPDEIIETLTALQQINIVIETDKGWTVVNFAKRQEAASGKERWHQWKERQREQEYYQQPANDIANEAANEPTNETLANRLTDIDIDIDTEKIKSSIGASAPAATPPKQPPKGQNIQGDPRSKHPAILCIKGVARKYPPLEIYDDLIQTLGEHPDGVNLAGCRKEWVKRGYNPNSWGWALDWYRNGIPPRFSGRNNGSGPPKRKEPDMTPAEIAAELAKGKST